jgi:hypothetical protein
MPTQLAFRWEARTLDETRAWWDAHLRACGFRDIEPVPGGMLSNESHRDKSAAELAEGEAYFCAARSYLARTRFPWRLERVVWEAHSRGQTMREVLATARASRLASVSLKHVHAIIARHRAAMLKLLRKGR